ncbi:hypothetical protein D3C78_1797730 [compost metagenome]
MAAAPMMYIGQLLTRRTPLLRLSVPGDASGDIASLWLLVIARHSLRTQTPAACSRSFCTA